MNESGDTPVVARAEKRTVLPRRPEFRKRILDAFKSGTVVVLEPPSSRENMITRDEYVAEFTDISNAAQTVLIDHIQKALIERFVRPQIAQDTAKEAFYAVFAHDYARYVRDLEIAIWNELGEQVREQTEHLTEHELDELPPTVAAYITYVGLGISRPPSSIELYVYLAKYAESYETLLQQKYGSAYVPELYYEGLQKHIHSFMVKFIGMDSVMSERLTLNLTSPEVKSSIQFAEALEGVDPLNVDHLELTGAGGLGFKKDYVDRVHAHVRAHTISHDMMGRTETRGCPVLYAKERDRVIAFAINEIIIQHRQFIGKMVAL